MKTPKQIKNPILKGCNPDPSIIRVGEEYYIATSTFEWWPGVQIHHSRDLVHWRLHSRPLNRLSQLSMACIPDGGIWVSCLSYDNGTFYLVVTNVKECGVHAVRQLFVHNRGYQRRSVSGASFHILDM